MLAPSWRRRAPSRHPIRPAARSPIRILAALPVLLGISACDRSSPTAASAGMTADPATNYQTGVVGTVLGRPLVVTVLSAGAPRPGVTVHWTASAGTIADSSLTDARGIASAPWTLDTVAGGCTAYARWDGAEGATVVFYATALPGPVANIEKSSPDSQAYPASFPAFGDLFVRLTDRYGNGVGGQRVTWTVRSGPATIRSVNYVAGIGFYGATVAPTGVGDAVVRAQAGGTAVAADFALTALRPVPVTVLGPRGFSSSQNGTQPATDTIASGTAMTWVLYPYDWDSHDVAPVGGSPSFQGGAFSYPSDGFSTVTVTFTAPGTYRYQDEHYGWTGTVVVR